MNKMIFITLTLALLISTQVMAVEQDSVYTWGQWANSTKPVKQSSAATSVIFDGSFFVNLTSEVSEVSAVDGLTHSYIKGNSNNAAVTLSFDNTPLSNQNGDDLVLFFISPANGLPLDVNPENNLLLSINGNNIFYSSSQLFANDEDIFADNGNAYLIENVSLEGGGSGSFDLSAIVVDLEAFGLDLNQTINDIMVNIGNNDSLFMVGAIGLNSIAVPLPASYLLFLSGITGLGFFSRHKKRKSF